MVSSSSYSSGSDGFVRSPPNFPASVCDHGLPGGLYLRYQHQSGSQFRAALISGQWQGWWIYWVGPLIGAFLASLACSFSRSAITVAKLYYFDSDRDGYFAG